MVEILKGLQKLEPAQSVASDTLVTKMIEGMEKLCKKSDDELSAFSCSNVGAFKFLIRTRDETILARPSGVFASLADPSIVKWYYVALSFFVGLRLAKTTADNAAKEAPADGLRD